MSYKDFMDKEVEIDPVKWIKTLWNKTIGLFSGIRNKSYKAWPDESINRNMPLPRRYVKPEVVDPDDYFFDQLAITEHTRKIHEFTDRIRNEVATQINIDMDNIQDELNEFDDNLRDEMWGGYERHGIWDSKKDYPVDIQNEVDAIMAGS